jgi:hypothetical protein
MMGDDGQAEQIKIELGSENDMFFHYTHTIDENGFKAI